MARVPHIDAELVDQVIDSMIEAEDDVATSGELADALAPDRAAGIKDPLEDGPGEDADDPWQGERNPFDDDPLDAGEALPLPLGDASGPDTLPPAEKAAAPDPPGPSYAWSTGMNRWEPGFASLAAARAAARHSGASDAWLARAVPIAPDALVIAAELLEVMGYGNVEIPERRRKRIGEIVGNAIVRRLGPPLRMEDVTLVNLLEDAPSTIEALLARIDAGEYARLDQLVALDLARFVPHPAQALLRAIEQFGAALVVQTFQQLKIAEIPPPEKGVSTTGD